jgi:hypothetical protein
MVGHEISFPRRCRSRASKTDRGSEQRRKISYTNTGDHPEELEVNLDRSTKLLSIRFCTVWNKTTLKKSSAVHVASISWCKLDCINTLKCMQPGSRFHNLLRIRKTEQVKSLFFQVVFAGPRSKQGEIIWRKKEGNIILFICTSIIHPCSIFYFLSFTFLTGIYRRIVRSIGFWFFMNRTHWLHVVGSRYLSGRMKWERKEGRRLKPFRQPSWHADSLSGRQAGRQAGC